MQVGWAGVSSQTVCLYVHACVCVHVCRCAWCDHMKTVKCISFVADLPVLLYLRRNVWKLMGQISSHIKACTAVIAMVHARPTWAHTQTLPCVPGMMHSCDFSHSLGSKECHKSFSVHQDQRDLEFVHCVQA